MAINSDYSEHLPKYIHIYEWLISQIRNKEIKVGDKLPTEMEIMARFGVNRVTVRSAMAKLEKAGMIMRRRGKGTFLTNDATPAYVRSMHVLEMISEDAQDLRRKVSFSTVRRGLEQASPQIASRLEITPGREILCLKRVASFDDEPVVVETIHMIPRLSRFFKERDLDCPYFPILAAEMDVVPSKSKLKMKPVLPTPEDRELLAIEATTPCMAMESVDFDQRGEIFEMVSSIYRGDKYVFTVESAIPTHLFERT